MIRFNHAVGVKGTWHLLTDPDHFITGPVHPLLKEPLSMMSLDKQHPGLTQLFLEVNLGLAHTPVLHRKWRFFVSWCKFTSREETEDNKKLKQRRDWESILIFWGDRKKSEQILSRKKSFIENKMLNKGMKNEEGLQKTPDGQTHEIWHVFL